MIIRIFSRRVFSFQLKLNNTDEETVIMRTPITIISIEKIINTFIIKSFYQFLFLFARPWVQVLELARRRGFEPLILGLEMQGIDHTNDLVLHRFVILQ